MQQFLFSPGCVILRMKLSLYKLHQTKDPVINCDEDRIKDRTKIGLIRQNDPIH